MGTEKNRVAMDFFWKKVNSLFPQKWKIPIGWETMIMSSPYNCWSWLGPGMVYSSCHLWHVPCFVMERERVLFRKISTCFLDQRWMERGCFIFSVKECCYNNCGNFLQPQKMKHCYHFANRLWEMSGIYLSYGQATNEMYIPVMQILLLIVLQLISIKNK